MSLFDGNAENVTLDELDAELKARVPGFEEMLQVQSALLQMEEHLKPGDPRPTLKDLFVARPELRSVYAVALAKIRIVTKPENLTRFEPTLEELFGDDPDAIRAYEEACDELAAKRNAQGKD
ncbi:hypothetical protein HYT05_03170 [Candidatus Kaiserbacteria bacterium]|nr:hypothetical protein [Candidatus Kaiserbacteria bacterium]